MSEPQPKSKESQLNFIIPVLLVLMIASLLVFIKVLPDLPAIEETTEEFREDKSAVIEAPPLPETDTTNVGITNPEIFEPEPPKGTKGDKNATLEPPEPSGRSKTLAGIVDALFYILVAVVGGFGVYFMFKLRKRMTIKFVFGSLIMVVIFATCIFFGFMILRMINFKADITLDDYQILLILSIIGAPVGVYISYSLFSSKVKLRRRNFALLLTGALMGSFLAALLPLYGVVPLVIAISLFDIYSVRKGPIQKIMTLGEENENSPEAQPAPMDTALEPEPAREKTTPPPEPKAVKPEPNKEQNMPPDDDSDLMLLYEGPEWSIGIGDFVIYSMFAGFVLTHMMQFLPYYGFYTLQLGFIIPWVVFLVTIVGLLIGYTYTLRLLSRTSLMPGLPMAMAMGLVAFFISLLIMEILNFLAYGKFAPVV